jgi:hypothetical protein
VQEPAHVLTAIDGAPLDRARIYRIATVRDLLTGMDHIEPLVAWHRAHPESLPPPGSGREIKHALVTSCASTIWRSLGGFDAVDEDHDGRVTEQELADAMARAGHEGRSEFAARLVLQAIDVDHEGAITRLEAQALEQRDVPGHAPEDDRGGS